MKNFRLKEQILLHQLHVLLLAAKHIQKASKVLKKQAPIHIVEKLNIECRGKAEEKCSLPVQPESATMNQEQFY